MRCAVRTSRARLPAVTGVITALVMFGALAPCDALRDAVTRGPITGVRLALPWHYVALSPVLAPMDVLGCLGFTEQVAVAVTIVLLFAAWRFGTRRGAGKSQTWLRTELIVWALFAGVAAAYVGVALLVGRPMALLEVQDPDTAVADFHSHTSRSHDGRHGFTAERNRAWHAAAGFDVAYITDHHVWGRYRNPRTAGDGTVLLSGAELRLAHAHILVLGDADRYADLVDTRPRRLLPERFVCVESTPPPVVIIPLPVVPERIAPLVRAACDTVLGIELHDSEPWGIDQLRA